MIVSNLGYLQGLTFVEQIPAAASRGTNTSRPADDPSPSAPFDLFSRSMTRGAFCRWLLGASFFCFALGSSLPEARAERLTAEEETRLSRGEVVKRTFDVDLPQGDFIGGVAYVIISAPPSEVLPVLLEPSSYLHIFALTQEARLEERKGDDFIIYLRQGGKKISGEYSVRARKETPSLVRFWLDPSRPHDIADCWGFFRMDPAPEGKTLLTYGALLHLEFGVMKLLFQEKIRNYALETPARLRAFVENKQAARHSDEH
jgi:hypothetical protein